MYKALHSNALNRVRECRGYVFGVLYGANDYKDTDETKLAERIHTLSIEMAFSVRLPNGSILQFGQGVPVIVQRLYQAALGVQTESNYRLACNCFL